MTGNGIRPLGIWTKDPLLDKALNSWYQRGCSKKYQGEPEITGEWGGSLVLMEAGVYEPRHKWIRVNIGFGDVKDLDGAVRAFNDYIEAAGYRVVPKTVINGCIFLEKAGNGKGSEQT